MFEVKGAKRCSRRQPALLDIVLSLEGKSQMKKFVGSWLRFSDDKGTHFSRHQYLLNLVLFGLAGPGFLFGLVMACMWACGQAPITGALAGLGVQPFYLLSYWLARRGKERLAAYIPVLTLFLVMVGASYHVGVGHITLVGYAMVALTAGILIGIHTALLFGLLSTIAYLVIGTMQVAGRLPNPLSPEATVVADGVGLGLGLVVLVIFQWLYDREVRKGLLRERALNAELMAHRVQLEQRVAERTAELTAANARLRSEIAERERVEAELREYAVKLERSNRELQSFAYIASHDLKEPLRKIRTFGDRLVARYGDTLDEQGCDYLARMQNAAARMEALIEGLLTYSRVTTKAQPFVAVDLKQVVREVLDDLEVRIEQLQARVEVGELPTVEADPVQMRQLFQNLIGNALKFHREGVAPVVRVWSEPLNGGEGQYQIMVEDNGIGFDEKYADRLFQVFQRLHGRSEYEGTGIGLAICRKIIERHGGSVTAEGTPGQGATFVVTLPARQNQDN
ncbi:MAG: hypothetical protein H5T62_14775 [Anaerolineae bacterium]|nr:hypothetical protein [Anaerolineae bacterium]